MKSFEQSIKKVKCKRIGVAIILFVIAFVSLVYGIICLIPTDIEYEEFNKNYQSSTYAKATLYYLTGPLIETTDSNTGVVSGYYIAVGEDDDMFIVRLDVENTDLPILGKNVEEEDVETLEGVEVYGMVQLCSSSLRSALNNTLNQLFDEEVATNDNFDELWGGYYLDTVSEPTNSAMNFFIIALVFSAIGGLYLLINKRIRKNVDKVIASLKLNGKLDGVIEEFEGEKLIEYSKLNVYLSPNYIFSFTNGLSVIAFKDIKEVSISKKSRMDRDKNKYIVILTKDNIEYYIAPIQKRKQRAIFNELLAKIKSEI